MAASLLVLRAGAGCILLADIAHAATTEPRMWQPHLGVQATRGTVSVSSCAGLSVGSDGARVLQAGRVPRNSIKADGRLDEPEWRCAERATHFVQFAPKAGAVPTDSTEARVLMDGAALLVAVRMFDAHPDSIIGRLGMRDQTVSSDWISVQVDSYHDRRTAFSFTVNARGVKSDALISDDQSTSASWDAVWDVSTHVDSSGWTAEFLIPLAALRFGRCSESDGKCAWGINFRRYVARREETSDWAPISPTAHRYVSAFGELRGVENLEQPLRLAVSPYTVLRLSQTPDEPGNPFYRKNAPTQSLGADVTYGLGSAFTLDATINPDFGQVEADASSVNLTAYETFFPEKRPFFQEGSDIFRFDAAGSQLFYSRRIGRRPQRSLGLGDNYFVDVPKASTVLGAAKLSGRTQDGWSIGVLSAVTGAETARISNPLGIRSTAPVEPLTGYFVARAKRESRTGENGVGFMLTALNRQFGVSDSLGFLRTSAYTGGIDARHRFANNAYELKGSILASRIGGSATSISRVQSGAGHYFQRPGQDYLHFDSTRTFLAGYAGSVSFGRISGDHFSWGTNGAAISPGFEVNDAGFQKEADRLSESLFANFVVLAPGRVLRNVNVGANQFATWSFGGEQVANGAGANVDVQFVNYWGLSLSTTRSFPALSIDALRNGPAIRKAGTSDASIGVYSGSARSVGFSAYGNVAAEDGTGGRALGGGVSFDARPLPQLNLSIGPYYSRSTDAWQYVDAQDVAGVQQYFFARVDQHTIAITGRVNLALSPALTLQVYSSPFVSNGKYSAFKTVRDYRARTFNERFRTFSASSITYLQDEHSYAIDLDGNGERDVTLWNPDFSTSALNTNAVLRWEYRTGSTLYAAWTQERSGYRDDGLFQPGSDFRGLFGAQVNPAFPRTNVFLLKMSYRLGR